MNPRLKVWLGLARQLKHSPYGDMWAGTTKAQKEGIDATLKSMSEGKLAQMHIQTPEEMRAENLRWYKAEAPQEKHSYVSEKGVNMAPWFVTEPESLAHEGRHSQVHWLNTLKNPIEVTPAGNYVFNRTVATGKPHPSPYIPIGDEKEWSKIYLGQGATETITEFMKRLGVGPTWMNTYRTGEVDAMLSEIATADKAGFVRQRPDYAYGSLSHRATKWHLLPEEVKEYYKRTAAWLAGLGGMLGGARNASNNQQD